MKQILLIFILTCSHLALADVVIEYEIHTTEDNPLVDKQLILPQKMTLALNEQYARIQAYRPGSIITSFDLYTLDEDHYYRCADFMGEGRAFKLSKPDYDITYLSDTAQYQVQGYPCKKALAVHEGDSIEIFYTEYFGKGFFPYGDLNGVALVYIKTHPIFGKIVYNATYITFDELSNDIFDFSSYKITPTGEPNIRAKEFIGTVAPEIKVRTMSNEKVELKFDTGKITVLNFWFAACAPCVREMPYLNELQKMYEDEGIQFLAISKDGLKITEKFLAKRAFEYDVYTNGLTAANKFGVTSFPANIIINKDGKIVDYHTSYTPTAIFELSQKLDELLEAE